MNTCLCDLGISHPNIEPCNTPEISPVGGEFEICLGCGHDSDCHKPQCDCDGHLDQLKPCAKFVGPSAYFQCETCGHDRACHSSSGEG